MTQGMNAAQAVEIQELAKGWMTKEMLDGMAETLFGRAWLSEVNQEEADQIIGWLKRQAGKGRLKKAEKAAKAMS